MSKCAVIGIGVGYGVDMFEGFVGSLRSIGYKGHIILGIAENAPTNDSSNLSNGKRHDVTKSKNDKKNKKMGLKRL